MLSPACAACPLKDRCPMRRDPMLCDLRIDGNDLRLAQRRATEKTETFRVEYRKCGGIEATISLLKRVTGPGRQRVRGRPVLFSVLFSALILRHHRLVASSRLLVA